MQDLGSFGGAYAWASGINNSGQIVGYSATASGAYRGFLYSNGVMTDLNDLLPSRESIVITNALAISDNGMIAAVGMVRNGQIHALLLTPR